MRRIVTAIMICSAAASFVLLVLFVRSFWIDGVLSRDDRFQRGSIIEYRATSIEFLRGRENAWIGVPDWKSTDGTDPDPRPPRGWQWWSSPSSQSEKQASWGDFVPVILVPTKANQLDHSYVQVSILEVAVALGIFPAFYFPKLARRWNRRRKSLCLTCGYDLRGGHDRCPECGTTVLSRVRPPKTSC